MNIGFKFNERKGNVALLPQLVKESPARFQTCYDASFAVLGPKLWNTLPKQINMIQSFGAFKDALTNYILQIPDTPPVPGMVPQNNNSLLQCYTDASSQTPGGYMM